MNGQLPRKLVSISAQATTVTNTEEAIVEGFILSLGITVKGKAALIIETPDGAIKAIDPESPPKGRAYRVFPPWAAIEHQATQQLLDQQARQREHAARSGLVGSGPQRPNVKVFNPKG